MNSYRTVFNPTHGIIGVSKLCNGWTEVLLVNYSRIKWVSNWEAMWETTDKTIKHSPTHNSATLVIVG